jgi:hypothetical protein
MAKGKTAGGFGVVKRGPGDDNNACRLRREKLAEKLTDLVGPIAEREEHEEVVIIVSNHTGTSVIGHRNTKWRVIEQALADREGTAH